MSLVRRRIREDGSPELRTVAAKDTGIAHGLRLEVARLDAALASRNAAYDRLSHENARLRAKLACYEAREDRMLDLRGEMHRGELDNEEDSWPDR